MELENFSSDGFFIFGGTASFGTGAGGFRHEADIRHVEVESQEEETVFYRADIRVDWRAGGIEPPDTRGAIASSSRSGDVAVVWDGATFAPQGRWKAGNRGPRPVPGAFPCRRTGRR
jgi:hypothetical protein